MSIELKEFYEIDADSGEIKVFNFLNNNKRAYTKKEIYERLKLNKNCIGTYLVRLKESKKVLCKKINGKWYWGINIKKKRINIQPPKKPESKKIYNKPYTKAEEKLILKCRTLKDRKILSKKINRTPEAIRKKRFDLLKRK